MSVTRWAGTALALAVIAPAAPGCLNECQHLCNSWYRYREVVCGEVVDAADLNRCLSDYRTLPENGQDDDLCRAYLAFVDDLDAEDAVYCGEPADAYGAFGFDLTGGGVVETP